MSDVYKRQGKAYARMVVTSDYPYESPETSDYVTRIDTLCRENLSEYYLVGNSVMVSEMDRAFDSEYQMCIRDRPGGNALILRQSP